METAGAAFRQENILGSIASSERLYSTLSGSFYDIDDNYNVYQDPDFKGYEDHAERFENVWNRKAFEAVRADIDREKKDREVLARSGWTGFALTAGASILDPTILLPGGILARGGRLGYSAARSAASVGAAAAASTAVQEGVLQSTQELRTAGETAINIGGSAILGAILGGGAAAAFSATEWRNAGQVLKRALDDPQFDGGTDALHRDMLRMGDPASVGAAAAPRDTLDDLSIADPVAAAAARATARMNPAMRLLHSPSVAARQVASNLFENSAYLKKHLTGRGDQAVESLVRLSDGQVAQALEATNTAYRNARRSGLKITRREFNEAVGQAMRRGDVSDVPGVTEAARAWRSAVFDPLKERAIKAGLLPEGVTVSTADTYFSRLWNRYAIEANEADFRAIVRNYIAGKVDAAAAAERSKINRRVTNLQSQIDELEMAMLRRREEWRRRTEGAEPTVEDIGGLSAVNLVRRYKAGERPVQPERLSQWLRKQAKSGIYDPHGDLQAVYPEARTQVGLLRKQRGNGVLGLDDLVLKAWEEGFLRHGGTARMGDATDEVKRPGVNDFLELLEMDVRGERHVVRISDEHLRMAAEEFDGALQALERAGIDLDRPLFGFAEQNVSLRTIGDQVVNALDAIDNQRLGQLRGSMNELQARGSLDFVSDADRDAYIDEITESIFQNVTGRGGDAVPGPIVISKRGPLKERVFDIPDELVEKFLDNDVELAGRRYARMMAADIELTEKFGSVTLDEQFSAIRSEFAELRARIEADETLTPKDRAAALKRINAEERQNIDDLSAVRDMLRGHYRPDVENSNFKRITQAVGTLNYLRTMGGVAVSSLTDIAMPVMAHGLRPYLEKGLIPLIRNMKAIKMSVAEAKKAGLVVERVLASRIASLSEMADPYSSRSPIENLLRNLSTGFSRATGIVHWTDAMQSVTSVLTQDRILMNAVKAAEKGFDALPAAEKKFMGELGVGLGRAEQIGRLFLQHGEEIDGVRVANTDAWGDEGIVRAYRAAVAKDVRATIIQPGVGDVPLTARGGSAAGQVGKLALQFKSFLFASNQRVLIRQLGRDRGRFVSGLVSLVTMGMMVEYLKQIEKNWRTPEEIPSNPGYWIAAGLDRSGVFSVLFELNNTWGKLTPAPDIYTALQAPFGGGDQKSGRYSVRSPLDTAAGPSAGLMGDTARLLGLGIRTGMGDGDVKEGDVGAARRMMPLASLPYLRLIIDGLVVPEMKERVAR